MFFGLFDNSKAKQSDGTYAQIGARATSETLLIKGNK
ncbi:MAG: Unknown protein [uncultured Aureispira sp.]|uniref:Uncharacterized protein n=1 Tax=uncultured Aureispira sp. TaxID=1331704 RepID=A0A6S6UBS6_9BACT|nr:MAG: Unknown protein [uncultured Aureispira sp.]